ncbi:MAG TPA: carboxypeptidase-like regulatory domain-containing protein, partial [Puia sp.]
MKAQEVPISGTVLSNDEGTPLAGVTVAIVGKGHGTATDDKGKFTITARPGAVLEFSYVGFSSQRIKAAAGMEVRMSKE